MYALETKMLPSKQFGRAQLGLVQFADYADGSWFQKKAPWDIQEVSVEENIALRNIAG